MRALSAALLLTLLAGCREDQAKSGWEYRAAHGAYTASLSYRFDDGEGTTLIGSCDGEPQFMLTRGAWDGPDFRMTADGKSWRFHSSQGEHGHSLVVSGHDANEAIANATTSIAFQVGNWRREIRPAAPLSRFASDCS
jgi:hypothetical protein